MTTTTELPELGAQIRAALEQLPPDADVTVRVRHKEGAGAALEAASVWTSPEPGGVLTRQCGLPAAVGLRMGLVDQALDQAGVRYPLADLGLRARWQRMTSGAGDTVGYELALDRRAATSPAARSLTPRRPKAAQSPDHDHTNHMESNVKANRTPVLGRRKVRHPLTAPPKQTPAPSGPATAAPTASDNVGSALLAVELALTGDGPWSTALAAIHEMRAAPDTAQAGGLFHGAPAHAFVLDAAAADAYLQIPDQEAVTQARLTQTALDVELERIVEQRLAAATERAAARRPPTTAELGLTEGMLGLGVILLRRAPGSPLTQQVIDYIAGLTAPVLVDGAIEVPGWYVAHHPAPGEPTPRGHVNLTMASGAAGMLAFLATAVRAGYSLESLRTPIQTLLDWIVSWQQPASAEWPDSPWWPRWVTPAEIQAGRLADGRGAGEALPSWSRMAGIARALQMGAGVLASKPHPRADDARATKALAEEVMLACLTDRQMRRLTTPGLWGGLAGLYQTGHRTAGDATGPTEIRLRHRMSAAADALRAQIAVLGADTPADLWTGESGVRLAAQTLRRGTDPTSRWDACLLITGNPRPVTPRSGPWS